MAKMMKHAKGGKDNHPALGNLQSAKAKSKLGGHGKENPMNSHAGRKKTESTPYSGATKQEQVGKGPRKNKSTSRKDAGLGGHKGH